MTKLTDTFDIYNGVKIPKVAFGTWQIPASEARQAVEDAIKTGYRHIDKHSLLFLFPDKPPSVPQNKTILQ